MKAELIGSKEVKAKPGQFDSAIDEFVKAKFIYSSPLGQSIAIHFNNFIIGRNASLKEAGHRRAEVVKSRSLRRKISIYEPVFEICESKKGMVFQSIVRTEPVRNEQGQVIGSTDVLIQDAEVLSGEEIQKRIDIVQGLNTLFKK